jgi:hypothetical protein
MKTMSILLAGLVLTSTAGGCCCWRNWFAQPAPVACAPAYPPAAPCDPCATAPVTYAPANVTPYTPPPQW